MSTRGRPRQITFINQDSLEQALAIMKSRKSGGTRTKSKHCAMILEHRKAVAALAQNPNDAQIVARHEQMLAAIGVDIAVLTAWVPAESSIKTLNNYRSIDPLRYTPSWIKAMTKAEFDALCDGLPKNLAKYEEFKAERKKRKPTTLRGILAQQAREKKRIG